MHRPSPAHYRASMLRARSRLSVALGGFGSCASPLHLRACSSLRASSTVAPSSALVRSLAENLHSVADVQDLLISYGLRNAAVPGVVRPIAVVKVGGEVITKDIDNLVASLRFLSDFGLQVRRVPVSCARAGGRRR